VEAARGPRPPADRIRPPSSTLGWSTLLVDWQRPAGSFVPGSGGLAGNPANVTHQEDRPRRTVHLLVEHARRRSNLAFAVSGIFPAPNLSIAHLYTHRVALQVPPKEPAARCREHDDMRHDVETAGQLLFRSTSVNASRRGVGLVAERASVEVGAVTRRGRGRRRRSRARATPGRRWRRIGHRRTRRLTLNRLDADGKGAAGSATTVPARARRGPPWVPSKAHYSTNVLKLPRLVLGRPTRCCLVSSPSFPGCCCKGSVP